MKPKAVATFSVKRGNQTGDPIKVHFNPVSLQYAMTNTMKDQGRGNKKKQVVSQSTGKLTMDLIFDTTDNGEDVRHFTRKIAEFMTPLADKSLPIVVFEWGTLKFQGMAEAYKETIDFFSSDGVPLRASVNLTLAQQDAVFDEGNNAGGAGYDRTSRPELDAVRLPPSASQSPASVATQAGNERAARSIAAANNLESLRFGAGVALTVEPTVKLGPPVAFSTGEASIGGGVGIGGGIGISGSTGAGISGGLGAGVSVGGSASAGISTSEGAFAGLRMSIEPQASVRLDPSNLLPRGQAVDVATDAGAQFSLGGQASIKGSASLGTDVGAGASLRARLTFDE